MENISDEEKHLASRLRDLCDRLGVEKDEKLYDSGQVILKMGKLYSAKAEECREAMLQKLTYIRASALLNGAKVRFELTKSLKMVAEVKADITRLHKTLLQSAGCPSHEGEDLDEIVHELKRKLEHAREMVELEVQEIPVINERLQSDEEQRRSERQKIEKVQALNELNTLKYEKLMIFITKRVIEVLGSPPCKFAIAGLGSLARKEITLYSDFEHVILLEDDIENLSEEDQLKIREYFRWFAVIFQIIIIGLGETFIRSVGVKSINDLSSGDKSKNWFYDNYTPCGMAFDGMVPHSCNTPLGRQEPTERKKHRVELIQAASKMARFLTVEEMQKNGYYLDDILKRTCLVYGSDEVYEDFCKIRKELLSFECTSDVRQKEEKRISNNVNQAISSITHYEGSSQRCDVKSSMYRPITVLISYFGRTNDIHESSTFGIVSSLRRKGIWKDHFCHRAEYAVAVACEARMKSYLEASQERNNATIKHWAGKVGKQSIVECRCIIYELRVLFLSPKSYERSSDISASLYRADNLVFSGFAKDALEEGMKILLEIKKGISQGQVLDEVSFLQCLHIIHTAYLQLSVKEPENKKEYLSKAVAICHEALRYADRHLPRRMQCYETLGTFYHDQGRHKESLQYTTKWLELYHRIEHTKDERTNSLLPSDITLYFKGSIPAVKSFRVRMHDIQNRKKLMDRNELLKYLVNELQTEKERTSRFLLRCHIAIQRIATGDVETGRKELLVLPMEMTSTASLSEKVMVLHLLQLIGEEQASHGYWEYDLGITTIEEHELMMNEAHLRENTWKMGEMERQWHNACYLAACGWRRQRNLPLDNKKLDVIKNYETYASAPFQDPYIAIKMEMVPDLQANAELFSTVLRDPIRFDNQFNALIYKAMSATNRSFPKPVIQQYTPQALEMMHKNAYRYFYGGVPQRAAEILWRIINVSNGTEEPKSVRLLLRVISSSIKKLERKTTE